MGTLADIMFGIFSYRKVEVLCVRRAWNKLADRGPVSVIMNIDHTQITVDKDYTIEQSPLICGPIAINSRIRAKPRERPSTT